MPQSDLKLPAPFVPNLRCPKCGGELRNTGDKFLCSGAGCETSFPIVDGTPVLINENSSVFTIEDFTNRRNTYFDLTPKGKLRLWREKHLHLPDISINIRSRRNYEKFSDLVSKQAPAPKVLVLGGSILGPGIQALLAVPGIQLAETDISFGPRTQLICDAHDIAFESDCFDAVVAQSVLEHVADPYRVVEEVHRVLKMGGLVYAESPFIQQVHAGRYDFTRFTFLGHRRLFRKFADIETGAVCGPGMALVWSYQYFFLSFSNSRIIRRLIRAATKITGFFWKYFDYYLLNRDASLDAASSFYFMGRKTDKVLSDRELLNHYRGANPPN